MTERDLAVVLSVYKHRYLSVGQIQRLHFPSLQTTYRRLRALAALQLIKGFTAPGITESIYHLAEPGAALVADQLGVVVADLAWSKGTRQPKDYYFLRHFLEVTDFRIALTAACGESGLNLLGFMPEHWAGRSDNGGLHRYIRDVVCDLKSPREKLGHTPDAVFALERAGNPALFLLEIDRGTEVVSNEEKGVLKAARFYLNYLLSGTYQRYQQDFGCPSFKGFRALLVTTSPVRVENIRAAVTSYSFEAKAKRFLWLTDRTRLAEQGVCAPVWLSADAQDSTWYRIG